MKTSKVIINYNNIYIHNKLTHIFLKFIINFFLTVILIIYNNQIFFQLFYPKLIVLKNISKIEGFLISKIKSSIDELLIFPNYHSIYISKDEN